MASRFLDEQQVARYRQFHFDFPERTLAGKVVLVAGGSGGADPAVLAAVLPSDRETLMSIALHPAATMRHAQPMT